jgi:hypothetical protein
LLGNCVVTRLGKLQATSPLLVFRGRSPIQGVSREREYIFHHNMLQLPVGGSRKTVSRQLSGLQTCERGDAEKEVSEDTQDKNGKGVLFRPHHSTRVLRGGAPRQDRAAAAESETSGDSGRSRHNGTQSPCGLTPTRTAYKRSVSSGP